MMINIKEASESDIPLIIELAQKSWFLTYEEINSKDQNEYMFDKWYSNDSLKEQMQLGQRFWILSENETEIGFSSITKVNEQTYKLNKIYLLPDFKGKGYGKKLLEFMEKIALENGASELQLNVNRKNSAVKFYETCNYKIIKSEDIPFDHYWMNDYLMQKAL